MFYMGGLGNYRTRLDEVAEHGYQGFSFDRERASVLV